MPASSQKKVIPVSKPKQQNPDRKASVLLFWVLNIILAIVITNYYVATIAEKKYELILLKSDLSSKDAIYQSLKYLAGISLIVIILGELLNIIMGRNSDVQRCMVNINNNMIVLTIAFAGLVLSCYNKLVIKNLFLPLLDFYIVGRILFAVGYGFGTAIGFQSLRAVGFGFIVACITIAGAEYLEADMLSHFKHII